MPPALPRLLSPCRLCFVRVLRFRSPFRSPPCPVFLFSLACPRSYDEGCVMVKLGREEPVASMDASGKIIWARHNEVQTANVKSLGDMEEVGRRWGRRL